MIGKKNFYSDLDFDSSSELIALLIGVKFLFKTDSLMENTATSKIYSQGELLTLLSK